MSAKVIDLKTRPRRATSADFTLAELERALLIVHVAVEEYSRDSEPEPHRSARLPTRALCRLLNDFAGYLSRREQYPPRPEPDFRELLVRAYAYLPADVWRGALGREIREALGQPLPSDRKPPDETEPEHAQ